MFVRYCVVLLVVTQFASCATTCRTSSGQDGDCKPITDCPPLLTLFTGLTPENAEILRSHHCGFDGTKPKVCCGKSLSSMVSNVEGRKLFNTSECGYVLSSKIIGGEKTGLDEFPWMALLEYTRDDGSKNHQFCGGVLISRRYVLTAAHCINAKLTGVRLGEYNLDTERDCLNNSLGNECAPPPIDVEVEEKIIHESYDKNTFNQYHDIALLRLKKEVTFTEFVKPICLPVTIEEQSKNYIGNQMFIAGWGLTQNNTASPVKLKAKVPVKDFPSCESTYRRYNFKLNLTEGQLCAGGEQGTDSCKGDSGGPLMTIRMDENKDAQWYVAGVVSFGPQPCGMKDWGGIYTRVSQYILWITSKIKP